MTRRTIIGFTGLAGSGKTAAARRLIEHHGYVRARFAGPLKDMLWAIGLTRIQLDGDAKDQPCELLGGRTPRYAMQTLGTEWGRDLICPDIWVRTWQASLERLPPDARVVADDCRFLNEEQAIRASGGHLVRIERPDAGIKATGHNSEGQPLHADLTILNTRSLSAFLDSIDELARDLSWTSV